MTDWKKVQAGIRELAKNWPRDGKNCIDAMAKGIEDANTPRQQK